MSKAQLNEDDEEKLLGNAIDIVKMNAYRMKICIDTNRVMEALKYASMMLSELRTSLLGPKAYYSLFMEVENQLGILQSHLISEVGKQRKMANLYELVQYAGNIIPRLYLLITIGSVYMKTTPGCRLEVLKDLVEMCRGVQHPLRGLFLRYYLLQSLRSVLPDVENDQMTEDDSVAVLVSINCLLQNFGEMNKLWVRMQHQGHTRDKERREKDRRDLRLLVGQNLTRLSQLESVNVDRYKNIVLPGILEQVVSCHDAIAQEYLMESLIQVFPDSYHLATLKMFLRSCAELVANVNVKNIIIALIDRLAASKGIIIEDDLFDIFSDQISKIISSRNDIQLEDIVIIQESLINFSIEKISDAEKREKSFDAVLSATLSVISKNKFEGSKIPFKSGIGKELLKFLKIPITHKEGHASSKISPIKMSLKLSNFRLIVEKYCAPDLHNQITLSLLNSALDSGLDDVIKEENYLTLEEIEIFLREICEPLIMGPIPEQEDEDFVDEQILMSRFIHYLLSPVCLPHDLALHCKVIVVLEKILRSSGPRRKRYTYPSLVFEALRIASDFRSSKNEDKSKFEEDCMDLFKFIAKAIMSLEDQDDQKDDNDCFDLSFRLCLEAALNACKTLPNHENIAYDFTSRANNIFDSKISNSVLRQSALITMIGTIKAIGFKCEEHRIPLQENCILKASNLVSKSDRSRVLLIASCLFYDEEKIGNKAVECIEKSKVAAQDSLNPNLTLELNIELLSRLTLLVKYEDDTVKKTIKAIKDEIEKAKEEKALLPIIQAQYENNVSLLKSKGILA